jgi:hypothetical protein
MMTGLVPRLDLLIPSLRRASAHLAVLEILANFGIVTTRQIARFRFDTPTITQEQRITRVLDSLRRDGVVITRPTQAELRLNPRLRWFIPVHGLTEVGCGVARHYEMGDPKPFEPEHSLLTVEHELKLSETQYRLERLAEANGWKFLAKQSDLNRTVKPDRLFGIDKGQGFVPLFYEEENKKKDLQDLYEKAVRYYDYWNTANCEKAWGWFRTFHVLWQFPNEERMQNFLHFLAGECHCSHYRGKLRHTCLPYGLRKKTLKVDNFWFTHDELTKDIGGKIWLTPQCKQYSLADL